MRLFVARKAVLAVVCMLSVSCSPPTPADKGDILSSSPTPLPIDPWKVASEWHGPGGPLGEAQRFLLEAPAFQCADEAEDLTSHRKSHGIARVIHHAALMMETDEPRGKNGIITDGKREFVFYRGRYGEEPGDAAATLRDQLHQYSLQFLFDAGQGQIDILGPEKVDGIEAEKYAWDMRIGGNTSLTWAARGGRVCVWLAKDNHRPVKTEWKGNGPDWDKQGNTHPWIGTRTYRYDPNVKVTLPGS